jgi:YHS domain-containing protein
MATVIDPVCGMSISSATAAGQSTYDGTTYYFCSTECKRMFDASPSKYLKGAAREPGRTAPKYGSAASGGLEYEPGREKD